MLTPVRKLDRLLVFFPAEKSHAIAQYRNASQVLAAFVIVKNSWKSKLFVSQWLAYAQDPRASTDLANTFGDNYQGFRDHRHDQSVLSILAHKWNIYISPTPIDKFIEHNRDKSQEFVVVIQTLISIIKLSERPVIKWMVWRFFSCTNDWNYSGLASFSRRITLGTVVDRAAAIFFCFSNGKVKNCSHKSPSTTFCMKQVGVRIDFCTLHNSVAHTLAEKQYERKAKCSRPEIGGLSIRSCSSKFVKNVTSALCVNGIKGPTLPDTVVYMSSSGPFVTRGVFISLVTASPIQKLTTVSSCVTRTTNVNFADSGGIKLRQVHTLNDALVL